MSTNKTGLVAKLLKRGGDEWKEFNLLMRNVPGSIVAVFAVSVVLMNLLANKEIHTGVGWLALDCGLTVSWLSFLVMDIVTKRFGAKASIQLSVFAVCCNLIVCAFLFMVSKIPGNWAEYYNYNMDEVNRALDSTIGGTWYVLMGSAIAFMTSSVVNAVLNAGIGRLLKGSSFKAFAVRSYVSTMVAQFVDNMVFTMIVSYVFFGWTITQCVTCSLTGCIMELICEVIFSPIGYRVSRKWEQNNIGTEYLEAVR